LTTRVRRAIVLSNTGGEAVKKKLTLTIDDDVYAGLKDIPRGVSISEIVSWILKGMIEDIKKGRQQTQEEFDEWVESTPEGRDFRERFVEKYGPRLKRIQYGLEILAGEKKKKKKGQ
jgi:predicted CopG family antitoxin